MKFKWTDEMEANFQEIKARLCGDRVIAPYDPAGKTRVYIDSGPEGTQATLSPFGERGDLEANAPHSKGMDYGGDGVHSN